MGLKEDEYVVIVGGASQRPFIGTRGGGDWSHVISNLQPDTPHKILLTLKSVMVRLNFGFLGRYWVATILYHCTVLGIVRLL